MMSTLPTDAADAQSLQNLIARTWKIYKSLICAPEVLRDVQDASFLLIGSLRLLFEYSQNTQLSSLKLGTLRDHVDRVSAVIENAELDLKALRAEQAATVDVSKNARRFTVQGTRLSSFYEELVRDPQTEIYQTIERIHQRSHHEPERLSWNSLVTELQDAGHSLLEIEEKYFVINTWLKMHSGPDPSLLIPLQETELLSKPSTIHSGSTTTSLRGVIEPVPETSSSSSAQNITPYMDQNDDHEDEELPGYEDGSRSGNPREKANLIEQTAAIINAEAAVQNVGRSKADPPSYTFSAGDNTDNGSDEEFANYIQKAIAYELRRRYRVRETHPQQGPFVYSWLSPAMQKSFAERKDIVSLLEANSFTAMAYVTAPRIVSEVEALLPILQMSADGSGDDTIFSEAGNTIKVMIKALARFVSIQSPKAGESMSDLDVLDYEYDTARAIEPELAFPSEQFDLAQKSYYNLLTYIMGLSSLMKDIFSGHVFVLRSRQNLTQLYQEKQVGVRVAWILKQLAGWEVVDEAVLTCRNWHMRMSVRTQAISALGEWQKSVAVLTGSEPPSELSLTIGSVNGLQKAHNYMCSIVLYASNPRAGRGASTFRHFEGGTPTLKGTRYPVWDQEHLITLPPHPKMIDIILVDAGLRSKDIARVRINFSMIPGVEMSLRGKDLLYGIDEQVSLPLPLIETPKGKEVDGLVLNLRFAWKGRFQLLEEAGMLTTPPGKMFRHLHSNVPLPFASFDGSSFPLQED